MIYKIIESIENDSYKENDMLTERKGLYLEPEYKDIKSVLNSKDLRYGYRGYLPNGEETSYILKLVKSKDGSSIIVVKDTKGCKEDIRLKDFLKEEPERLNIKWLSLKTFIVRVVNNKYWISSVLKDSDLLGKVAMADDEVFLIENIEPAFTYYGQDIELPKITHLLEANIVI